jgi:hypothetical protein
MILSERAIGEWVIPIAALLVVVAVEYWDDLRNGGRLLKRLIQWILE